MSLIVAARFDTFEAAGRAAERLRAQGFGPADVSSFFVNPPGQHSRYHLGGDEFADSGARRSHRGAIVGAVLGLLAGGVAGALLYALFAVPWVLILGLAAVGAYVGSLAGAMRTTAAPADAATMPGAPQTAASPSAPGGRMPRNAGQYGPTDQTGQAPRSGERQAEASADRADPCSESRESGVVVAVQVNARTQALAAGVLRNAGGRDVERAQGEWRDGQWVDFDPTRPPVGAP